VGHGREVAKGKQAEVNRFLRSKLEVSEVLFFLVWVRKKGGQGKERNSKCR
jgi:hypothetical protein